jgi:hypothetical protein
LDRSSKKFSITVVFPVAFEKVMGDIAPVAATQRPSATNYPRPSTMSGCSSGVEHNLAKVGVGRSNRLTRSIFSRMFQASVLPEAFVF